MNESRKRYQVRRIKDERVPGEELVWDEAELLTDITFPWTPGPNPATRFRALWDESRFYFLYEIEDNDIVLGESADPVERVTGSDRAEIFFTCNDALDPYYCLEMDPRGEVFAYAGRHYREFTPEWEWPGLEVAAAMTENGYRVEGSLPMNSFAELDLLHGDGTMLKAGVYRAEFSHRRDAGPGDSGAAVIQDWMSWVDPGTERPDFHVPTSFGEFHLDSGRG